MYSFVMQDWITIQGSDTTPVIQTEKDWLEMSPYQDLVAWVDVRQVSNGLVPNLHFDTAPAKDEILFVPMGASPTQMTVPNPAAPKIVQLLMGSAAVPVAKYVRWRLYTTSAGSWEVTFRILVAANAPGLHFEAATDLTDLMLPGQK